MYMTEWKFATGLRFQDASLPMQLADTFYQFLWITLYIGLYIISFSLMIAGNTNFPQSKSGRYFVISNVGICSLRMSSVKPMVKLHFAKSFYGFYVYDCLNIVFYVCLEIPNGNKDTNNYKCCIIKNANLFLNWYFLFSI